MNSGFPGAQSDWPAILERLKDADEFLVYQGAMEMRDKLAYAQENQMHGFTTEQFMEILVKIVVRDPMTDLSNEVKFFAVQCLTTLMDIFPSLVNGLVNAGLVKGMTTVMQGSFGFIDLSEACIKAYEKIVVENPPAVLRSGAVACIFQQMDFFELGTQNRIFRIIQKIARHSTTEADFDTHILPILPFVCMQLNLDAAQGDQKRVEDVSKIVCELQESFCIFYSPSADFQKVGQQFDKLLECGVFDIILAHVRQYSEISVKIQAAQARSEAAGAGNSPTKQSGADPLGMEIDGEGQIDSAGQSQVLTHQTILNFFKILENACRYSSKVANKLFGQSTLLHDLCPFLPHDFSGKRRQYNSEDFPLITEVINLLSSVFSEKQAAQASSLAGQDQEALQKRLPGKMEFEAEKRSFQLASSNRGVIVGIAEHLLPRIFMVYDQSTINPQFRIRTLQVIDKIIDLFDNELLKGFIEPGQFASFIVQILRAKHSSSIDVSLTITRKVMDCSPEAYSVPLIREGVSQLIRDISTEDKLKAFLGISQDIDIRDKAFDLDIHEVKEALHFTRMANPDDHAMRDFYERKLIELVEHQKYNAEAKQAEAAKKGGEAEKAGDPKERKQNIAVQIIAQSQAILADYFENQEFITNLAKFSPETKQQLDMLGELTQLSRDLCQEATQIQDSADSMANIRRLLTRIADLLTLEHCAITSYEFKQSKLLLALELLLTKSPSQAKVLLVTKKAEESGEEMKRSEEIDLQEAQKQSKQLSKKESRCIMNRLKLFAHILLITKSGSGQSPMRALIELNHELISENDAFILSGSGGGGGPGARGPPGSGGNPFSGSMFGGLGGHMGMPGLFAGGPAGAAADYDHCISALRQLQKRVTVNLIYDPKKQHQKQTPPEAQPNRKAPKKELDFEPKQEANEDKNEVQDVEDSQMEDLTPESLEDGAQAKDALVQEPVPMKKGQSHHPQLHHLAGSPKKEATGNAIEQAKINQSKVFVKRHHLFAELAQIPVTVEQSSCLQILEDFLRNRIKTMDHVKGLKFDYGFGGGGPPGSSSSSPFGGAFGGHYQSITQKILRKNLGNGAKKLLDRANERLAKILNAGSAYKIKQTKKKGKKPRKLAEEGYGDEMEGVEAAEKSGSGHSDDAEQSGEGEHDSDKESGGSDAYSDMDEDEEDEHEMAAEMEKQRLLDLYVEELPEEVINSEIPEEQQHMLIKILTRQHAFMIDQLKMNYEDAAAGDHGEEELAEMAAAREEDMYRLEERLEDFQETMERVQARFLDKKAEQGEKKATQEEKKQEEEKKGSDDQPKLSAPKGLQKLADDSDQEMNDMSQDVDEQTKKAEVTNATAQAEEGSKLAPLAKDAEQSSSPHVKLTGNANDAEMMKPADLSDSELQHDNEMEGEANPDSKKESQEEKEEDFETKKKNLEKMLEKEFEEQDKKIQKALEREKELRQKMREVKHDFIDRNVEEGAISAQTEEVLHQDLEELIKQQGEDIDFEFYFEGKQIWSSQSIFEIIKDGEKKRKQIEKVAHKAEQVRALQEREEELRRRARKLAEAKTEASEAERNKLKKESERLKDLFNQISGQFGAGGMRGGPPGYAAGLNAHKIYFCIKDRADEMADLKRQRLDSLTEFTGTDVKRARTKSEAIRDISSSSIDEFVASILQTEFKVFEEEPEEEKENNEKTGLLSKIDEEMEGDKVIESSSELKKAEPVSKQSNEKHANQEKEQLGQALKVLKALNFLFANQDLISSRGIRFIMKAPEAADDDPNAADFTEPGFSDLDLKAGFAELQASFFHHHKLDSYLQRSIKDPYNLVQGAISSRMQQIFQNCPFLFPFSTKQLYFKLVSFISAIDVHRAIYFLRQHIKQGGQKVQQHEKDKRTRQKVQIQRDKLIPSGFALISKIDKRAFLEFEFQGEEGVGLGPTLEFYDNIADEFKKWTIPIGEGQKFTMWRQAGDNLLFPSPVCLRSLGPEYTKQIYEIFRLCGTIVAKAIVDDRQIDLAISPLFWRLCLGSQMSIFDFMKLDEEVFETLAEFQVVAAKALAVEKQAAAKNLSDEVKNRQLESLTMANGSRVEQYGLTFTLPGTDIELVPGGKDREVVLDNAQDWVDLMLHQTFHETIKLQVSAFKKGFNSIFPISSLAPFCHSSCDGSDLEQIVCGSASTDTDWSPESLTKNVEPDHGYSRKSPQYLYFIRYMSEIPPAGRAAFLKFLTGSKRLPIGGFANLNPHLTLVLKKENPGQHPGQILPSVMACQNYVKSPTYDSYEVFTERFDYAVREGQQNFTLS